MVTIHRFDQSTHPTTHTDHWPLMWSAACSRNVTVTILHAVVK